MHFSNEADILGKGYDRWDLGFVMKKYGFFRERSRLLRVWQVVIPNLQNKTKKVVLSKPIERQNSVQLYMYFHVS